MSKVSYNKNTVYIDSMEVNFKYNILEIEEVSDKILVLLKIEPGCSELDNLYCISRDGKMLWRIEAVDENYAGKLRFPYFGISSINLKHSVVDFYGRRFFFDIETGKIVGKDIVK
ncbi:MULTISPECIES: hypothetical protein [Clostridium]|jgi:hypothetical protein|uniref:hypothetical protein n=1 Tax=Clostridium TaxID=1485 RepID=UPI001DD61C90|nr:MULTISPECIES: hypothetical protein [Clostridium]MBS5308836.1 hypothetical protein [Clostridium sp.]MDB1933143.1 hypothetical protein [Clostridium tertium]MDB1938169.1 hypothetical protein [Clostridium tertium]MDB1944100.1 hypothetical protein [Clostridium tertium]MDB1950735.1 hypothetical protein [Clostridium tertium]